MKRIIDVKIGDFDEFYQYVIEHANNAGLDMGKSKQFKEWLRSKMPLVVKSNSYFFDWGMWVYCYSIYKELIHDYDHLSVFVAKAGRGKSHLLMQMCAVINPNFSMKYICYNFADFTRMLPEKQKYDTFALDEGALILNSLDMDKKTKSMDKLSAIMRQFNLFFGICLIDFLQLRRHFRDARVSDLILIDTRGEYTLVYGKGIQIIKEQIRLKYGDMNSIEIPDNCKHRGTFFDAIPQINDITKESYIAHKKQSAAKFVDDMSGEENQDEDDGGIAMPTEKLINATKAAKILGISKNTLVRYLKAGKVPGKRTPPTNNWHIKVSDLHKLLRGETC